jgi:hypothetical protein
MTMTGAENIQPQYCSVDRARGGTELVAACRAALAFEEKIALVVDPDRITGTEIRRWKLIDQLRIALEAAEGRPVPVVETPAKEPT